jgi:hypothetical protein
MLFWPMRVKPRICVLTTESHSRETLNRIVILSAAKDLIFVSVGAIWRNGKAQGFLCVAGGEFPT